MFMKTIEIGDTVQVTYNSGVYIGKILEDRKNFWLVEVRAIDQHPQQGDLHHPGQIDKGAFHERKALAYREKINARKRQTTLYETTIPDYKTSLFKAVDDLKKTLNSEDTPYNKAALQKLSDLEKHFYHK